jgi:hypothetical protein
VGDEAERRPPDEDIPDVCARRTEEWARLRALPPRVGIEAGYARQGVPRPHWRMPEFERDRPVDRARGWGELRARPEGAQVERVVFTEGSAQHPFADLLPRPESP